MKLVQNKEYLVSAMHNACHMLYHQGISIYSVWVKNDND